jgi:hypothetical protein
MAFIGGHRAQLSLLIDPTALILSLPQAGKQVASIATAWWATGMHVAPHEVWCSVEEMQKVWRVVYPLIHSARGE